MIKGNGIEFYKNEINFRQVIEKQRLQQSDEALFVCDINDLRQKYEIWNQLMPGIKPHYAVKCNDDPMVIKTFAQLGANFDCASKGEIKLVLAENVEPQCIIFAMPCKPLTHLAYAKENGVMTSTVDSEFEILKIHQHFPESKLILRIRCDATDVKLSFGEKFGCNAKTEAPAIMLLAKKSRSKVIGISFHVGTGCNELPAYDRAITEARHLFDFGKTLGFNMNILDIGGGFPGSDFQKFKEMSKIIRCSVERNFPEGNIRVIAEPGRYFVESAYTLICKIHSKRETKLADGSRTKHYYINDGVFVSFANVVVEHYQVVVRHLLDDDDAAPTFKTTIWGPTCDAYDKVGENLQLPDLKCEDFLIFPNMGAYSIPLATRFNGFGPSNIVYFDKATTDNNLED
ncbi:ornithine decarboxylase 1-like [Musca vetustissima]|uniref:ornithine decarboxylase 1-like n=1 Tax=Musca vetustissima TaxID=27455 RepID=UPI002AB6A045|nr:ornithine decarboxylase 1-like [Musca vetustissima]